MQRDGAEAQVERLLPDITGSEGIAIDVDGEHSVRCSRALHCVSQKGGSPSATNWKY